MGVLCACYYVAILFGMFLHNIESGFDGLAGFQLNESNHTHNIKREPRKPISPMTVFAIRLIIIVDLLIQRRHKLVA